MSSIEGCLRGENCLLVMAGRAGRFVVNSASLFRFERLERFEPLERLGRPECFAASERSTVEA